MSAHTAAFVLRVSTAAVLGLLVYAYVVWLRGSPGDQDQLLAKKIWAPVVWLIRNPPDVGLTTLAGVVLVIVVFFEPIHDFIMDLDEIFTAKRRQPEAAEKKTTNPPVNTPPPSDPPASE